MLDESYPGGQEEKLQNLSNIEEEELLWDDYEERSQIKANEGKKEENGEKLVTPM